MTLRPAITVLPLGAGQDHMGYSDHRRFPDFSYLSKDNRGFDGVLDVLLISHFHLDHCGALPYFTEKLGYNGTIIMSAPTKAICPVLLEDSRKIMMADQMGAYNYSSEDIRNCMAKVTTINVHETIKLDDDFEIKAYYAGHVLGAVMFHIRVGNQSVVYTGDYNMTPDRHLGAAWIDKCRPDLLITESTYATMIRDSKRARERSFLKKVHACVSRGGKVLIPSFAVGRAQELCILLDTYWDRLSQQQQAPIYFSGGLTSKSNDYYKLFITWTNQKLKQSLRTNSSDVNFYGDNTMAGQAHTQRNPFDFKHIKPFERKFANLPGPMVLFASPGMLHSGLSLDVFKMWAADPKNMIILPGYCSANTVGAKVLALNELIQRQEQALAASGLPAASIESAKSSIDRTIVIDRYTKVVCNMDIENLSFSAHADVKGIMQLIRMCEPDNVMLVHGERHKMTILKADIQHEFNVPVYDPPNHTVVSIPCNGPTSTTNGNPSARYNSSNGCVSVWMSSQLMQTCSDAHQHRVMRQINLEAEAAHFGSRVEPVVEAGGKQMAMAMDEPAAVPYVNPCTLPYERPSPLSWMPFRGVLVAVTPEDKTTSASPTSSTALDAFVYAGDATTHRQHRDTHLHLLTPEECIERFGTSLVRPAMTLTVKRSVPSTAANATEALERLERAMLAADLPVARKQLGGHDRILVSDSSVQAYISKLQDGHTEVCITWQLDHDKIGSLVADKIVPDCQALL
ncbi:hypothetical protein RI367_005486 [Sorochytrium milnesiophthora]